MEFRRDGQPVVTSTETPTWRRFLTWQRSIALFVVLQASGLALLLTRSESGVAIALAGGLLGGLVIVTAIVVRSRYVLAKVTPRERFFGSVASVWPAELASTSEIGRAVRDRDRARRYPARMVDGFVWIDREGVHWYRRDRGRVHVAPFDIRRDEIHFARVVHLGLLNAALELQTHNGQIVTFKTSGSVGLADGVRRLDVPTEIRTKKGP